MTEKVFENLSFSLSEFIANDLLKVAALKGPWGAGKTYFWKDFLDKRAAFRNKFKAYSYVSLFGLKDIEAVKKEIYSNADYGKGVIMKSAKAALKVLKGAEKVDVPEIAGGAIFNNIAVINSILENQLLNGFLICIDDLERMEDGLDANSLMGLISYLATEKKCKILIIYNNEETADNLNCIIKKHREKVIDMEVSFSPSIERNISFAWTLNAPSEMTKAVIYAFDMRNIRILKHVRRTQEYFAEHVANNFPNLRNDLERRCAIITILYYGFSSDGDIVEVTTHGYHPARKKESANKMDAQILKIKYYPSPYDFLIAEFLVNGHVDIASHGDMLNELNSTTAVQDVLEKSYEFWEMFTNDFTVKQDEFVPQLIEFLNENAELLAPFDVARFAKLLVRIDPTLDLAKIVDESMEAYIGRLRGSVEYHLPMSAQEFPELMAKIRESVDNVNILNPPKTLGELMLDVADDTSTWPSRVKFLAKYSKADFYQWLETESHLPTKRLAANFLKFYTSTETEISIASKIREALLDMSKRSAMDRCRVEDEGLIID